MNGAQIPAVLATVLAVNALGFALMGADKRKAKGGRPRIRERSLLCVAFFGGAPGVFAGMRVFRHKTRRPAFSIGVLLTLLYQLAAAAYLLWRFM